MSEFYTTSAHDESPDAALQLGVELRKQGRVAHAEDWNGLTGEQIRALVNRFNPGVDIGDEWVEMLDRQRKEVDDEVQSERADAMMRCAWAELNDMERTYHDTEWGVLSHDPQKLFEKLCLEGAQAGLSWDTILKKRDEYRRAFHGFDVKKVAQMSDEELEDILQNSSVVRNRLKVFSVRKNALATLEIMKTQDFGEYIWSFVGGRTVQNNWRTLSEVPVSTAISERMSKDLKKRGFSFVGPTICYAFMQSMGLVNDHLVGCFRYKEVV